MSSKLKLPEEVNIIVERGVDEMQGEYICKRCKGWGYLNEDLKNFGSLSTFPLLLCSDCDGGGTIDWIKRPRQN
jgi:DnaJ-class molecular chaperone